MQSYKIISDQMTPLEHQRETFMADVLYGLSTKNKVMYSRYFYDDVGSELFTKITHQPEYYLTRCERDIIAANADYLASIWREEPINLVELGAGDGQKTRILIDALMRGGVDFTYTPIDISEGAMVPLVKNMGAEFPKLKIEGLVTDYFHGMQWISNNSRRRSAVLFLGSSIGNFPVDACHGFLVNLWNSLQKNDDVFIGFDLKKHVDTLTAAYSDNQGVTENFNLNLLTRINRELGANFDIKKFHHVANYNFQLDAMQSFLVSTAEQEVHVEALQRSFSFEAWESILMESSFKYTPKTITNLAKNAGFEVRRNFFDERAWFCDALWRVTK